MVVKKGRMKEARIQYSKIMVQKNIKVQRGRGECVEYGSGVA